MSRFRAKSAPIVVVQKQFRNGDKSVRVIEEKGFQL